MEIENGVFGLYLFRCKKKALKSFSVAIDNGEIFSDDSLVVDNPLPRPICVNFRFNLSRPNYIFPGFFEDVHIIFL